MNFSQLLINKEFLLLMIHDFDLSQIIILHLLFPQFFPLSLLNPSLKHNLNPFLTKINFFNIFWLKFPLEFHILIEKQHIFNHQNQTMILLAIFTFSKPISSNELIPRIKSLIVTIQAQHGICIFLLIIPKALSNTIEGPRCSLPMLVGFFILWEGLCFDALCWQRSSIKNAGYRVDY